MAGIKIVGAAGINRVANTLRLRSLQMVKQESIAMERVTKTIERDMKQKWFAGVAGTNDLFGKTGAAFGTGQLGKVTGTARKTLVSRVFTRLSRVIGVVGTPLAYVAMHEFGGQVTGSPLLRIPTKFSKKPSGQDKLQGRSARTLPEGKTALFRSARGNLFIWEVGTARAKAAGRPIPLYLLVPSVTFKARHMFRNSLRANKAMIREHFGRVFASVRMG